MSVVDVVHVLQIYENGELGIDEDMYEIFRLVRCKKKKKIYVKKKIIIHKTIFTLFGNLPMVTELQGFHYFQRKIQSAAIQFFFSLKNNIKKNSNLQKQQFFISYAQDSQ